MSHKRKGQLTVSTEWAKHLRKFLRRKFWKVERRAGKKIIGKMLHEEDKAYMITSLPTAQPQQRINNKPVL